MAFVLTGIRFPTARALGLSTRSGFPSHRRGGANLSPVSKKQIKVRFPVASATGKVLVPGTESDDLSSSTTLNSNKEAASSNLRVSQETSGVKIEDNIKLEAGQTSISSELIGEESMNQGDKTSVSSQAKEEVEDVEEKPRLVPPPGTGQRIYEIDPSLKGYRGHLDYRYNQYKKMREMIDQYEGGLEAFSRGYEKFGFQRSASGITYREWAPGAKWATLIGDFNNWNPNANVMIRNEYGAWEVFLPNNADGSPPIPHGSRVKIRMDTPSGIKDSIPAWIKFSVQAPGEIPYNGIYYDPPEEEMYVFQHPQPKAPKSLRIYESHVGMSSPEPKINTYTSFRDDVLPQIKRLGYNAVQIMAIQEHSYYASFGYHVTNFFAPSSRFGTPDELKSLIDRAHELGLLVLMDIDMYDFMALDRPSTPRIDRGIALHKMIRLVTMGLGGEGYLNFMGNEFGHPEWIDFPRGDQHLPNGAVIPGNNYSYDKCRRMFDLGDADYLRYRGMQEFDQAMQHLEEQYGFMTSEHQYISRKDEGDKMIIFERGNLVFVFNFHWSNSYVNYRVGCLKPGKYKVVLDSDDKLVGGFDRIDHAAEFFSTEGLYDNRPRSFLVYAPSRTAAVYAPSED